MPQPEKIRMPLKRRRSEIYEDPLQHLWAISYSDLLMVLMTFFILFYNFSTEVKKDETPGALENIIVALKSKGEGTATGTGGGGGGAAKAIGNSQTPAQTVGALFQALQERQLNAVIDSHGKEIIIQFGADIFKPGQYTLSQDEKSDISEILKLVKPYEKSLLLTFVGHTDKIPFGQVNRLVNSNIVLSTLRASRAVEYAILQGISPQALSAQGVGEFERDSRTLSLKISERRL